MSSPNDPSTPLGGQARGRIRVYDRPAHPPGYWLRVLMIVIAILISLLLSYWTLHHFVWNH